MTDPVLKFRRERDEALAKLWTAEDRIRSLEATNKELEARCIAMVWLIPGETLAGDLQATANRVRKILDSEAETASVMPDPTKLYECPVCRRQIEIDEIYGSCANTKDGHHRRTSNRAGVK